jgi:hypothetical protein
MKNIYKNRSLHLPALTDLNFKMRFPSSSQKEPTPLTKSLTTSFPLANTTSPSEYRS